MNTRQHLRALRGRASRALASLAGACPATVKAGLREALFWIWVLHGRLGRSVSLGRPERVIVVFPSYDEKRTRNVAPMVRAFLRCRFVERVVVSNNNPRRALGQRLRIADNRLRVVNHSVRRGCGAAWTIAGMETGEHFIVVDDDVLLFPRQVACLFRHLLDQPEVPHGLVGIRSGRYHQRTEMEVDNLNQLYAVSRAHLATYADYVRRMVDASPAVAEAVERWGDDIVVSRVGRGRPRIHDAGFILRCWTANATGVATHTLAPFESKRTEVERSLARVLPRDR